MKECCKYFLQPQDSACRHASFGNGYLSRVSLPAGSARYSDALLPLISRDMSIIIAYQIRLSTVYPIFLTLLAKAAR